jgi:hypothetical protein
VALRLSIEKRSLWAVPALRLVLAVAVLNALAIACGGWSWD